MGDLIFASIVTGEIRTHQLIMSRTHLRTSIEQQSSTNLRIGPELADIVEFLITNGYIPNGPAIKTSDLTSRCSEASYYRVTRLHDELGMVMKFSQGPNTYLIHTRLNDIVNGQGVSSMVNEELRRVAQHARQNPTVRQIVASARGVPVSQALQGLQNGNFPTRQEFLVEIVTAIQNDSRVTRGNYGMVLFRTPANLYRATPLAIQLYRK